MNWHDLLGFMLILGAAAAIPGPDVAAIVGSGLSGGLARAFNVIIGIIIGHAIWMTAAITGLAVALSNPKALVFFSAVVPSVLPLETLRLGDDALLILCSSVVFVVVFGAWALLAAKARAFLGNAANRRGFNRVSALLIAGSAALVATR